MSSYKQNVIQVKNASLPSSTTPQERFWRKYISSQVIKENYPIQSISFDENSPFDIAITSSRKVQIYSSKTRQSTKTLSRFKDNVLCANYKPDGKLLAASDATGLVSLFEIQSSYNFLFSINPTSYPTHVVKFHPLINIQIITASNDRIARLYDISNYEKPLVIFGDQYHNDYIKSVSFLPENPNLIVTGCYDGYTRVFDLRNSTNNKEQLVAKFNHGDLVEDVISLSSSMILSAGGPLVKVWDIKKDNCSVELNNFNKAVTSLHDTVDKGLMVGSLDGTVKIFSYASFDWKVDYSWKFNSGILCCSLSPLSNDHKHFIVGFTSGVINITSNVSSIKKMKDIPKQKTSAYSRIICGKDYDGQNEIKVIQNNHKNRRLKHYEKNILSFKWSEALDDSFVSNLPTEVSFIILNDLKNKGKIRIALYNRNESSILKILQWLNNNLHDARSCILVSDFIAIIIEMYGHFIEQNVALEQEFININKNINLEISKCIEANEISGMLKFLSAQH